MVKMKIISARKTSVNSKEKETNLLQTIPPFINSQRNQPLIETLCNRILNDKQPKHALYMTHMQRLLDAYAVFRNFLDTINHPNKEKFNRAPSLYRFCRYLIPEVSHPLIFYVLKRNKDPKILAKIAAMYDAFCLLVMMNTCIDDCADHLQDRVIVTLLGEIHRGEKPASLIKRIPSTLPEAQKTAYTVFIECTSFLWQEALHILENICGVINIRLNFYFKTYVLAALDNIIDCMKYSIACHQTDFGDFQTILKQFQPGMMIHVFFPLQECVVRSNEWVDLALIPNTEFLREQFEKLEMATSVLGRLGNDIGSFEKELDEGPHTNSLLHLCQDKMNESEEPRKRNVKDYTLAYSKASNAAEKKEAKRNIMDLIEQLGVMETLYQTFSAELDIIRQCNRDCSTYLSRYPSLSLSEEIQQLYTGNIHLLLMYVKMSQYKGVT